MKGIYRSIYLRVVLFFVSGFIMTYLSEYLSKDGGTFGDFACPPLSYCGSIDKYREWGVRHYWYFFAGISMAVMQVIDLCVIIYKEID
jgi:hypothetical protein